jgi:hypothetical protein
MASGDGPEGFWMSRRGHILMLSLQLFNIWMFRGAISRASSATIPENRGSSPATNQQLAWYKMFYHHSKGLNDWQTII